MTSTQGDYATVEESGRQLGRAEVLLQLAQAVEDGWTPNDVLAWVRHKSYEYGITECKHPDSRIRGFCLICVRCGTTLVDIKAEQQWERGGRF